MKNTYPTGYTSIICEDIRMETGNKISLMGVFSSGQIIFNNEGKMASPIAIYISFPDGEGTFNSKFEIENPKGEINIAENLGETTILKGKVTNFVYKFDNLTFKFEGKHVFRLHLDDEVYNTEFSVELSIPK